MLSNLLRGSALAAILFTATMVSAAEPDTKHFRAKEVLGTKILLQNDKTSIGTVDDIVFDEAGNMEYLIVDNGGKLTTIPWDAAKFDIEKKTAVVGITMDQYKVIPTYTTTTYPTFYAPAYRTETYKYYGLTPRELRQYKRR
jgi:sporulation protein YlmC with PRC-barrel domain